MNWTIESARQHFSELLHYAAQEPQTVFNEKRLVATVIDAQMFKEFEHWRLRRPKKRSIAHAFEELRQLCLEENYFLEVPNRYDRDNAFNNTES
jgi:hypothetical protein